MKLKSFILITGSSGFLGSKIYESILINQYNIIILKSKNSKVEFLTDIANNIQYEFSESGIDLVFLNYKIDFIIHTATCYGRNNEDTSFIVKSNLTLPLYLIEKAISNNVKNFFYSGTLLKSSLNPYSISKYQFEMWGKYYSENNKINFVNFKLENFFGPGEGPSKFVSWLLNSLINRVDSLNFTDCLQKRDFIYIDDAINAIQLIINSKPTGYVEYEIGYGNSISVKEFIYLVIDVMSDIIPTQITTNLNFGSLPKRVGEPEKIEANIQNLIALGWKPKYNLEEGIKETINHIIKQNNLDV